MEQLEIEEPTPVSTRWWQVIRVNNRREICCGAILVLSIASFLVALICALIPWLENEVCPKEKGIAQGPLCETPACLAAADHILKFVNENADPCEDFHSFVCGKFQKNYKFFNYKNPIAIRNEQVNTKLERWLTDPRISFHEKLPSNIHNARVFYQACMNLTQLDEGSDEAYFHRLDFVTGKWPLKEENVTLDWPEIMGRARDEGFFHSVLLKVEPAYREGYVAKVGPPDLPLWMVYMKDLTLTMLEGFALNTKRINTSIDVETRQFSKFIKEFKELVLSQESYQTVKQISELKNSTLIKKGWLEFLKNVTGIRLKNTDEIIYEFKDDSYLEKLHNLTEKFGARFAKNYIILRTLVEDCQYLNKYSRSVCEFVMPNWIKDRKEFCRKEVRTYFDREMEMLYSRQVLSQRKRKAVKELMEAIKESTQTSLLENKLLSHETRTAAASFLNSTMLFVGYTNISFDEKWYTTVYGGVKYPLVANETAGMHLQLTLENEDFFFYLQEFPTGSYEDIPIPTFEAAVRFGLPENIIYALTPILAEPMFEINRAQYLNFGSLGTLIGRAFVQAFLYNEAYITSLQNDSYWEAEMMAMYRKEHQPCIVKAYMDFMKNRTNLTSLTEAVTNELLATFGGVNLAYHAYQQWLAKNGEEKSLPGVKYTPKQLFWIMTSTYLCEPLDFADSLSEKDRQLYFMNHPISSFSINGPKMYSPDFAKDFNCKNESKMNLETNCFAFIP